GGTTTLAQPPSSGGHPFILTARHPHLPRSLLADHARQVSTAESAVKRADARPRLPESRILRRDRQVADHMQHVSAADRDAIDRGDDRLGYVANDPVQPFDFERAPLGLAV